MIKYRNIWATDRQPEFYMRIKAKEVLSYKGVKVYELGNKLQWDYVVNNACFTQRAGYSKEFAMGLIDCMIDNKKHECPIIDTYTRENFNEALNQ